MVNLCFYLYSKEFSSHLLSSGFLLSSAIAMDASAPDDLRGVGLAILLGFVSD